MKKQYFTAIVYSYEQKKFYKYRNIGNLETFTRFIKKSIPGPAHINLYCRQKKRFIKRVYLTNH